MIIAVPEFPSITIYVGKVGKEKKNKEGEEKLVEKI